VLDRFFKRQIEECQELARHAVDKEDRAFWQQAAARWEEQLRLMQHRQSASPRLADARRKGGKPGTVAIEPTEIKGARKKGPDIHRGPSLSRLAHASVCRNARE
jgi:hypothetical protein